MTNNQLRTKAQEWADAFTYNKKRKVWHFTDKAIHDLYTDKENTPESLKELNDFLEIDAYDKTVSALDAILEVVPENDEEAAEDMTDELAEAINNAVPIYNMELIEWLTNNWVLMDEVAEELGAGTMYNGGLISAIQIAYSRTLEEHTWSVYEALIAE